MHDTEHAIAAHYRADGLGEAIRRGLVELGCSLDAVGVDDLAPVDEFHLRGREATAELAELAGVARGCQVLDIGSGIGGTARYLASAFDCHVNGIELVEGFCTLAEQLSALVGLSERTRFRQGSALELPFHDDSFDVVWTEHVQMNVADKARFYAEALRVLRPGGTLAFHDVFAGANADALALPVPWASTPQQSALCTPDELRELLTRAGCTPLCWIDSSDGSRAWFEAIARSAQHGPPPLGLHLVMGRDAPLKIRNVVDNLARQAVVTVQAVLRKRAR